MAKMWIHVDLIHTPQIVSPLGKNAKQTGKMSMLLSKAECLFIISHREKIGQHRPKCRPIFLQSNQEHGDMLLDVPGSLRSPCQK